MPRRANFVSRSRLSILLPLVSFSAFAVSRSVWEGVYTKEQAGRGQTVYRDECMKCHGENLMGGEASPGLVGDEFLPKWNGKTVGALFQIVRKTMPTDDPGNLSTRQYSDVVAYILNANGFPVGQTELERDIVRLNEIRIETKR
jgi:mono/diheme cytochrome c family protein